MERVLRGDPWHGLGQITLNLAGCARFLGLSKATKLSITPCNNVFVLTLGPSVSVFQSLVSFWAPSSLLSIMRGRFSRKLGMLAKAGFLLWLLWLGYLLLERASYPSSSSEEEDDEERAHLVRQVSLEETGADGMLARPLYIKPALESNAPGEWGRATHLNLSPEEKKEEQDSLERYAINIYVSDRISLHRHIQDSRMAE